MEYAEFMGVFVVKNDTEYTVEQLKVKLAEYEQIIKKYQELVHYANEKLQKYVREHKGCSVRSGMQDKNQGINDFALSILGLNINFEREDSIEQIVQKTDLPPAAAEFIKQKYDLLKSKGLDLHHDSITPAGKTIEIYRPTAARTLLRSKEWIDEFFSKFLVSSTLDAQEIKKIKRHYDSQLWEAAQDQLKQYFLNLPEFRALTAAQKQDLENCANNAPDNGGTKEILKGIDYLNELETNFEIIKKYTKLV